MADVFFSYSSKDRERVRPIRDALVAEGFDVFWDQEVPPGRNWDEWIRQHLDAARCVVVFWSAVSVKSDNVVHEATIAKNAGKLIPVLLDPIGPKEFPMGHYTMQGFRWEGNDTIGALRKIREEIEAKAMPCWMRRKLLEESAKAGPANLIHDEISDLRRAVTSLETAFNHSEQKLVKLLTGIREDLRSGAYFQERTPSPKFSAKDQGEIIFIPSAAKRFLSWLAIAGLSISILISIGVLYKAFAWEEFWLLQFLIYDGVYTLYLFDWSFKLTHWGIVVLAISFLAGCTYFLYAILMQKKFRRH